MGTRVEQTLRGGPMGSTCSMLYLFLPVTLAALACSGSGGRATGDAASSSGGTRHTGGTTGSTGGSSASGGQNGTDTGTGTGAACPRFGSTAPGGGGTSYHVGPEQAYATIGAVPWYSLKAGDTVYIHYQSTPYHEKFLVSGQGTAEQWIRVFGVPGPSCELPVISGDGATTSSNMHNYWQDATGGSAIQDSGIIEIAVNRGTVLPAYIQIAGLEVRDSGIAYKFTAENGTSANYGSFSACIYAHSANHILVSGNTLHNCGLGFYNWIGDGSAPTSYWAGLEVDTVLQGNYFYDNGAVGSYTCHQSYTESQGVTIEYNHYGAMKTGALGSQIKDRSAGTIIRYNYIEQSPQGWDLDLVNPQNSWAVLGSLPAYGHDFVYGNIIVDKSLGQDLIHWNEDDQSGHGRANQASGTLAFYDNTVVLVANQSDIYGSLDLFNETWGGFDCPSGALPGVIDQRNNIYASLPRTAGSAVVPLQFGYCGLENLQFRCQLGLARLVALETRHRHRHWHGEHRLTFGKRSRIRQCRRERFPSYCRSLCLRYRRRTCPRGHQQPGGFGFDAGSSVRHRSASSDAIDRVEPDPTWVPSEDRISGHSAEAPSTARQYLEMVKRLEEAGLGMPERLVTPIAQELRNWTASFGSDLCHRERSGWRRNDRGR